MTTIRSQSLAKLQATIALDTQVLGIAKYGTKSGRMCGIGVMLTEAQRADLVRRRLNNKEIGKVAQVVGWHNLEAATGLRQDELQHLQATHDAWAETLPSKSWSEKEKLAAKRQFTSYVGRMAQMQE